MAKVSRNKKMNTNAYRYYDAGNLARFIQTWEYTEQVPNTYVQPKPIIDKNELKQKALYHIRFLLTAIVVCACCITMMIFNSTIVEKRRNIKTLNAQLRQMKQENLSLQADISEQLDLKYIEKVATEKLKMAKPNKYQIVYIDVPKSNYTIQYSTQDSAEAVSDNKLFLSIKVLMNRILGSNGDQLEK